MKSHNNRVNSDGVPFRYATGQAAGYAKRSATTNGQGTFEAVSIEV